MSEKKKHPLEARVGEPLHRAHETRLRNSTIEHSRRVVETKIVYPDPETVSEADLYDPRVDAAPSEEEDVNEDAPTDKAADTGDAEKGDQ